MATDVSPWITKWQRAPNVLASIRSKVAVPICKRTVDRVSWMAIWFCARAERTTLRQAVDRVARQSEEEMRPMVMGHLPICFFAGYVTARQASGIVPGRGVPRRISPPVLADITTSWTKLVTGACTAKTGPHRARAVAIRAGDVCCYLFDSGVGRRSAVEFD